LSTAKSRDRVRNYISGKIVNEAAAGSPYSMHRISRELGRQRLGSEEHSMLAPEVFFVQVCQSIFVCRTPAQTLVRLEAAREAIPCLEECPFGLCGLAMMRAVYQRDWYSAEAAFETALRRAREIPVALLLEAVLGLRERFLFLPRDGHGTRLSGSSNDLLWMANCAEEHFCAGRFREAADAATFLEATFAGCGWVRTLQLRSLIIGGEFEAARSLLQRSDPGVIPAGDALAWDSFLHGLLTNWGNCLTRGECEVHSSQQFRMPLYFQGLTRVFQGDRAAGLILLERAVQLGEPAALMRNFDPVSRYGAGLAVAATALGV